MNRRNLIIIERARYAGAHAFLEWAYFSGFYLKQEWSGSLYFGARRPISMSGLEKPLNV